MSTQQLVVDYSSARPDPQHIRAVGYVGVMRYLSHTASKNLTPGERDGLRAAGLAIGLVWETFASRVLSGGGGGAADMTSANDQADALGFPTALPIYYAVDFDAQPNQFPVIEAYLVACRGRRPVGVYGGLALVDSMVGRGVVEFGWQTVAWSHGQVSSHAALYQRLIPTLTPIPGTDENVILGSAGLWTAPGAPVPVPPQPLGIPAYPGYVLQVQHPMLHTATILRWQQQMISRGWKLTADGFYGPSCASICKLFQREKGLVADGRVGPKTWDATWR